MREIERVVEVGRIAIRKDGADLRSVAAALLVDAPYAPSAVVEAPSSIEMTDDMVAALNALPLVFGRTQVDTVRSLSGIEQRDLGVEQDAIDRILKPLEARREA